MASLNHPRDGDDGHHVDDVDNGDCDVDDVNVDDGDGGDGKGAENHHQNYLLSDISL